MLSGRIRFFTLILALLASLLAIRALPDFFQPLDYTINDWRTRIAIRSIDSLRNSKLPASWSDHLAIGSGKEGRVVIVDIDEQSLAQEGAWPWPREKIAQLIKTLIDDYGVAGVALDIVFPEAREQDETLALQLRRPQVTGAVVYDLEHRGLPENLSHLSLVPDLKIIGKAPRVIGLPITSNHSGLAANRVGHITPIFDADGSIRRLPPLICGLGGNDCRPLLGIAAFMGLLDKPSLQLQRGKQWNSSPWELQILDADHSIISAVPINDDGTLTVPYRHLPQDWTAFSATKLLQHAVDASALKSSVVLLGGTALGMSDVVSTPVRSVAAGIEPHAEVVTALFDNNFLITPKYGIWLDALFLLPLGLLLNWALKRFVSPSKRAAVFPLWLVCSWFLCFVFGMSAYIGFGLLLPVTPLFLFPIVAILFAVSFELYLAGKEHLGIVDLLATYLPKQIANKLSHAKKANYKSDDSHDASRREITVLFADIHGFSGISENKKPEIIAMLMQRIFSEMAEAVANHGGTIDKFIGDAIMAFWNAPDDDALQAEHAVKAAQEMLQRIQALGSFCEKLGFAPIEIGIGIETGFALVGHFGSEHRRTYTALGEPVVLASRIEGLTTQYQQAIILGESCAAKLDVTQLEALGQSKIRGRQQSLALFAPKKSD